MWKIYRDGDYTQHPGPNSIKYPMDASPIKIIIGNKYNGGEAFPGYVTDFRIYDRLFSFEGL